MQAEGAAEEDVRQGLDESTRNRLLQGKAYGIAIRHRQDVAGSVLYM